MSLLVLSNPCSEFHYILTVSANVIIYLSWVLLELGNCVVNFSLNSDFRQTSGSRALKTKKKEEWQLYTYGAIQLAERLKIVHIHCSEK